eukprot:TRINITY_DN4981_c0_g1_i3.p1 TRINITY_DN4981_c0_g1~~TRINITY_DN4981_c0_g1_i3.p1  ORF type:complete len:1020 (-),score=199.43 TRINITY_DN4981_c0_g1_i3:348-3407(-)
MVREGDDVEGRWDPLRVHSNEELWITGTGFSSVLFLEQEDLIAAGETNGGFRVLSGESRVLLGQYSEHTKEVRSIQAFPDTTHDDPLKPLLVTASEDGFLVFWRQKPIPYEGTYGKSTFSYPCDQKIKAHEGGVLCAKQLVFEPQQFGGSRDEKKSLIRRDFLVTIGADRKALIFNTAKPEESPVLIHTFEEDLGHLDVCGNAIGITSKSGTCFVFVVDPETLKRQNGNLAVHLIQEIPSPFPDEFTQSLGVKFFENNPSRIGYCLRSGDFRVNLIVATTLTGHVIATQSEDLIKDLSLNPKESNTIFYHGVHVLGTAVVLVTTVGPTEATSKSRVYILNHDENGCLFYDVDSPIAMSATRSTPYYIPHKYVALGLQNGTTRLVHPFGKTMIREYKGPHGPVTQVAVCRAGILSSSSDGSAYIFRYFMPDEIIKADEINMKILQETNELREKANAEFKKGLLKEALQIYSDALARDDSNSAILSNRALAYAKLGRWDDVIADCEKGICSGLRSGQGFGILPQPSPPYLPVEQAIACFPLLSKLYNRKGDALARKGKWAEAADSFQKAMSYLRETNTDIVLQVLKKQQEYQQLEAGYKKSITMRDVDTNRKKATEETKNGNYHKSLDIIQEILDALPSDAVVMKIQLIGARIQNFFKLQNHASVISEVPALLDSISSFLASEEKVSTVTEKDCKDLRKLKVETSKLLAFSFVAQKDERRLKDQYEILAKECPSDPDLVRLAVEYRALKGTIAFSQKWHKEKEYGLAFFSRKMYRDASESFDRAMKQCSDNHESCYIRNMKAAANFELRNLTLALNECNRVIQAFEGPEAENPEGKVLELLAVAYSIKSRVLFETDAKDEASQIHELSKELMKKVKTLKPHEYAYIQGISLDSNKQFRRKNIDKALLEIREEHSNGDRLMNTSALDESLKAYEKAIRLLHQEEYPEILEEYQYKAPLYYQLALLHIGLKDYKEADEDIKKALLYEPNVAAIWETKGLLDLHFKRFKEGVKAYTRSYELNPE